MRVKVKKYIAGILCSMLILCPGYTYASNADPEISNSEQTEYAELTAEEIENIPMIQSLPDDDLGDSEDTMTAEPNAQAHDAETAESDSLAQEAIRIAKETGADPTEMLQMLNEQEKERERSTYEEEYQLELGPKPKAAEEDPPEEGLSLSVEVSDAPRTLSINDPVRHRVACGRYFYVFLEEDGTVKTWGAYDISLGYDPKVFIDEPTTVKGIDSVISIANDTRYGIVALKGDGTVWRLSGLSAYPIQTASTEAANTIEQIEGLSDITALESNGEYCLALKADGTVWEWGMSPIAGEIAEPQEVQDDTGAALGDVCAISIGADHSLALQTDGEVYAWGDDFYGQLGDGERESRSYALPVKDESGENNLNDVVQISAQDGYSAAVKNDETTVAWGKSDDVFGQSSEEHLWYATARDVNIDNGLVLAAAADDLPPIEVVDIARSGNIGLALGADESVWQCGKYQEKIKVEYTDELGEEIFYWVDSVASPWIKANQVQGEVPGTVLAASAFGNAHTIVNSRSGLTAAGDNTWGQLGNETFLSSSDPVSVMANGKQMTGIKKVSNGYGFSVILKGDSTVWSVGWDEYGKLGDGSDVNKNSAVQVKGAHGNGHLRNFRDVSAGYRHAIAVKNDGSVWAWGSSSHGQLGGGDRNTSTVPIRVKGVEGTDWLKDVISVYANANCSMALKSNRTVYAWGNNDKGQVGDGTTTNRDIPVQVRGKDGIGYLTNIKQIATAEGCSLALSWDGTVWSWGGNQNGRLGGGDTRFFPDKVQKSAEFDGGELTDIVAISAGYYHNLALDKYGNVWAWGKNNIGQLGINNQTDQNTAVKVKGVGGNGYLSNITAISAGREYSVAARADGRIFAWGYNKFGQFGIGTSNNRSSTPVIAFKPYLMEDDDYSDFFDSAFVIADTGVTNGKINYADDVDIFKFSASFTGTIALEKSDGISVALFDGSLNPLVPIESDGKEIYPVTQYSTYYVKILGGAGDYSFSLMPAENSISVNFNIAEGKTYVVNAKGSKIRTFAGKTFIFRYDPSVLQMSDLIGQTYLPDLTAAASTTGVEIQRFSPGTVIFTINKTIPADKQFSGLIDSLKLKALKSGNTAAILTY